MKFMVLCLLDAAGTPASSESFAKPLAQAGLLPVGSSRLMDGAVFGLERAYLGEFRAPDAQSLEATLSARLRECLATDAPPRFQLFIRESEPAPPLRKRA